MFGGFTLGTIMLGVSPYALEEEPSYGSDFIGTGYYLRFDEFTGNISGSTVDETGYYKRSPTELGDYTVVIDDSGEFGVV